VHLVSRSGGEDDIQRGAGGDLALTATRTSGGELRLDWSDVDGAARYLVEVNRQDGSLVSSREVTPSELVIDLPPDAVADGSLTVSVTAVDALGTRLGQSPLVSVP
jgi:hypothetical protein